MNNQTIGNSFSVGIPTYNQAEYLRDTLNSLLNQKVAPLEIVVSNNHSTDRTAEVLDEFKGRIRVIQPPQHLGMMQNWNFLVENLKGTWFSLLSSDDIAKPNFVSTLLEGSSLSKRAVLVRAGWETIDMSGEVLDQRYLLSVRKVTSPPHTLYENLLGPKTSFAAFAVRHDAWRQVGGFPEDCGLFGDWAFWIKLSPLGDFVYQHKLISGYRSNYRPGIQLARLISEIKDELEVNLHIIPETSRKFEDVDLKIIKSSSRKRFLRRLDLLIPIAPQEKLSEIEMLLEPWAVSVDCSNQLNEFVNGTLVPIRPNFFGKYARSLVHYLRK